MAWQDHAATHQAALHITATVSANAPHARVAKACVGARIFSVIDSRTSILVWKWPLILDPNMDWRFKLVKGADL